MFKQSRRRILSLILTIFLTVSLCLTLISGVLVCTATNDRFVADYIMTDSLVSSRKEALDEALADVENEYKISCEALESFTSENAVKQALLAQLQNIKENIEPDLYTEARLESFNRAINQYCTKNELKYNEKKIEKISKDALVVYASVLEMDSLSQIYSSVKQMREHFIQKFLTGIIISVFSATIIYTLFSKKSKTGDYYFASLLIAGILTIAVAIAGFLLSGSFDFAIEEKDLALALLSLMRRGCISTAIGGIIAIVCAFIIRIFFTTLHNKDK